MRQNAIASIATAILTLCSGYASAGQKLSLQDLSRYEGVWKHEVSSNLVTYSEHRILSEYGLKQQLHVSVDPKSHEIVDAYVGFVGLDTSGEQFVGIAFEFDGTVKESVMVPHNGGFVSQDVYIGTNGSRVAVMALDEFLSATEMKGAMKNVLAEGRFLATVEASNTNRKKVTQASLKELIDQKEVLATKWHDLPPAKHLAPLHRLLGHWLVKGSDGKEMLNCLFEYRGGKRWMVETWKFTDGSAGVNVSGIDPATGELTLWSMGKNYMGRAGRWDELSEDVLGQVQGDSRLVREFSDARTFKAHWQQLQKGAYVDIKDGAYTGKLVDESHK